MSLIPADVPAPLASRMAKLLAGGDSQNVADVGATADRGAVSGAATAAILASASPDALAAAGLAALRRALSAGSAEAAASDLLAADALITHACANAATDGVPDALAPERFVALLEDR